MKRIHIFLLLLCSLCTLTCSKESLIEGLVFGDKIVKTDVNKTFDLLQGERYHEASMKVNDEEYGYSIIFDQNYNDENSYVAYFSVGVNMGFMRTQGGAVYPVSEGEEIGDDVAFITGYAGLFRTIDGETNLEANPIELGKPFYIGFCADMNGLNPTYGWLKMEIRQDKKIFIYSYAYRAGKPIKAGEQ